MSSPALLSPSFNTKSPRAKHDLILALDPHTRDDYGKDGLWDFSDALGCKDIDSKHEEC